MNIYRVSQWILIFFIYSFFGWIWESGFKSIQKRKFINRGYLNGPWLPIYGFGAMIILFVTLPFKNNQILIFMLGMITASVFELLVGCTMEKLFHVRYWDYTKVPFNIKGYIALPVSLLWGLFSLVLVNIIDVPISKIVSSIPVTMIYFLDIVLSIFFIIDMILSTIQAFNLKAVLHHNIVLFDDLANNNALENMLSEKILKKAEKIFNRNPSILSKKLNLNRNEIKILLEQLKEKFK